MRYANTHYHLERTVGHAKNGAPLYRIIPTFEPRKTRKLAWNDLPADADPRAYCLSTCRYTITECRENVARHERAKLEFPRLASRGYVY